ncbi:hypothetical protein GCM10027343_12110 [Noviherbaspirillum agri]
MHTSMRAHLKRILTLGQLRLRGWSRPHRALLVLMEGKSSVLAHCQKGTLFSPGAVQEN